MNLQSITNNQVLHDVEFPSFSQLVTPYQNKKLPVYNWFSYKHSFSRDLILRMADYLNLGKEDKIFDPFCGAGTTLLALKELGINSCGIDILPLSVFLSNAKLQRYDENRIISLTEDLKELITDLDLNDISLEDPHEIGKFFPIISFKKINYVMGWIRELDDKNAEYFFLTALLSILESLSYTSKDGAFLRFVENKKITNFDECFFSKILEMINHLDFLNSLPPSDSKAILGDARKTNLNPNEFNAVITSPPYPNRHDYTRIYMLELLIGFHQKNDYIKKLRYSSVRSHVEAKKMFETENYAPPYKLTSCITQLKNCTALNQANVKMLNGYFEDMYLTLLEMDRLLLPKSKIIFVVSNVRYQGVLIPVDDILNDIAKSINFKLNKKILARERGNSPQQMKKYGRMPSEESILIWEKND